MLHPAFYLQTDICLWHDMWEISEKYNCFAEQIKVVALRLVHVSTYLSLCSSTKPGETTLTQLEYIALLQNEQSTL